MGSWKLVGILNTWVGGLSSSRNPTKLKSSFLLLDLKQANQRAVDGDAVCSIMPVVPPLVPLWE